MQRFQNILCVVEPGEAGNPALERAVSLTGNHQARLTVVAIVPQIRAPAISKRDRSVATKELQAALVREHEVRLAALIEPYRRRLDVAHRVLIGTPFLEVIREVLRDRYDLVIRCPESPSWLDRFLSGDDMHLLRKCPCPVWIVKPQGKHADQRILAAVDVDDAYPPEELRTRQQLNVLIMGMAASLAISESAEFHVIHAWESITEMAAGSSSRRASRETRSMRTLRPKGSSGGACSTSASSV